MREHGLSEAPEGGYDVEQLVEDIHRVLKGVAAPERFTLIAHSFGGALTTRFIQRWPHRVEKWVVLSSPVRFVLKWNRQGAAAFTHSLAGVFKSGVQARCDIPAPRMLFTPKIT